MSEISTGVTKIAEYPSSVFYRVLCSCMNDEHNQTINMEYNEELNDVSITISSRIYSNRVSGLNYEYKWYSDTYNFFVELKHKISLIFKLLKYGYLEAEGDIILSGANQINDYISALEEGYSKVTKNNIEYSKDTIGFKNN